MSLPRYGEYKSSGVSWLGDVPNHWRVSRLKYACMVFPSNIDKHSRDDEPSVRLCNYTDVYYNERITADMHFMKASASADQIAKFTLKAGDTLITKDSETADDIAIAAYVPEDLPGVVCGYHLSMVRPLSSTSGAFVKRLFDSVYTKARFAVAANGLTRVGLGQYALDNIELPFPPVEEQAAIAAFLDREAAKIDALIAEQEKLIALLTEKRQATIAHAVTRGLNPNAPMKDSGVAWLSEVPAHWAVKKLRYVANVVRGASPRPAGDPRFFASDNESGVNCPWVTVAEVTKNENVFLTEVLEYLTPAGVDTSQSFKSGTLIFTNSGATLGVPKILTIDCCANDGILAFRHLSDNVAICYLYYFLLTTTERLRTEMKQGGGQPNLNTGIVKEISLALPPIAEQLEVVEFLESEILKLDSLRTQAERAIALLQERRSALIAAAVTGQFDVRSAAQLNAAERPEALAA
jgi:type I restriction enzyme S subunit